MRRRDAGGPGWTPAQPGRLLNETELTAKQTGSALIVPAGDHRARDYCADDLPERIRSRISADPASGCWLGQANIDRDGYSRLDGEGLHRVVWAELVGPIPPGHVLDHREDWGCTSKACCWPGHLLPVTHRVNVLRGRSFAAVNHAKNECDHGHPYDLFNTYFRPNGNRDCRACIRRRVAEYQARLRADHQLAA